MKPKIIEIKQLMRMMMVILLSPVFAAELAYGKEFGVVGAVFPINELPFVQMMEQKAAKLDIEVLKKQMQSHLAQQLAQPQKLPGIIRTSKERQFHYDPSYVVAEDIILPCGKILHAKGTKINPLEHMDLTSILIFLDGTDEEQKQWLITKLSEYDAKNIQVKIILVAGSPGQLGQELAREVYFDQLGQLTTKFGISQVPALVKQDRIMLIIEEIVI